MLKMTNQPKDRESNDKSTNTGQQQGGHQGDKTGQGGQHQQSHTGQGQQGQQNNPGSGSRGGQQQ
jgi:hypothetical protein